MRGIEELLKGLLEVIGGGHEGFETDLSKYVSNYFLQLFFTHYSIPSKMH